jgi:vacuolar protein sorting-associated protein 13A/C
VRNRCGYGITVWAEARDCEDEVESMTPLKDGEEVPWCFDDWRRRREKLEISRNCIGVKFDDKEWHNIGDIPVDVEGTSIHKIVQDSASSEHYFVCDVMLRNDVKVITFRSTLSVHNATKITLEVAATGEDGEVSDQIYTICK